MRRISVTGWVEDWLRENVLLEDCGLDPHRLRSRIKDNVWATKKEAQKDVGRGGLKRVRVTVEVDVEEL